MTEPNHDDIAEGVRAHGRRNGRYGLDRFVGLDPALQPAFDQGYAEGQRMAEDESEADTADAVARIEQEG